MLLKNPISEPYPTFIASPMLFLCTRSSAMTAPKNGPATMPTTGITNGPTRRPIVLPHIPAFEPPYRLTPT